MVNGAEQFFRDMTMEVAAAADGSTPQLGRSSQGVFTFL